MAIDDTTGPDMLERIGNWGILAAFFVALLATSVPGWANSVTVFAAASLKPALDEIVSAYEMENEGVVHRSYAGSSTLARQIQHGAPAQVFISANTAWMDLLEAEGLLVADTRRDLLTNRLVLIASSDFETDFVPVSGARMDEALGEEKLAIALVRAVPSGIYGKQALTALGFWEQVQDKLVQTDNVAAALRLVAIGEAPLGVVYSTDAGSSDQVRTLGVFAKETHDPIIYPAAIVSHEDTPHARAFLEYLSSKPAIEVFAKHGFSTIQEPE